MELLFQATIRRYNTSGLLSIFLYLFFGCSPSFMLHAIDPVFLIYSTLATALFFICIFSVHRLLSGSRQIQRYFELHEHLFVSPILGFLSSRLNGLAAFAGVVPVIS